MKKIILAVLAGIAFNFITSTGVDFLLHAVGYFPPYGQPMFETDKVLLAFAYRSVFTILSAYVTARIANENAKKAVWIIGTIGSLLWLAGAITLWDYAPAYYNIAGIFTGIPLALIGLSLYKQQTNKRLLA